MDDAMDISGEGLPAAPSASASSASAPSASAPSASAPSAAEQHASRVHVPMYKIGVDAQGLDGAILQNVATTEVSECPLIGQGAFGKVYKCTLGDGIVLVRKVSEGRVTDPQTHRDFVKTAYSEAALIYAVQPYRVIGVYADDDDFGSGSYPRTVRTVLLTEFVPGKEMIDVLEVQGLPETDILQYVTVMALHLFNMLAKMESMGVLHRDVKLDNVLFDTRSNRATLIDWGLACTHANADADADARACSMQFSGTPSYMSPFSIYAHLGSPQQRQFILEKFEECQPLGHPLLSLFRREDQWGAAASIFYALIYELPIEAALHDAARQALQGEALEAYLMPDYVVDIEEYIASFRQHGMPIPRGDARLVGPQGYAALLASIDPAKVENLMYDKIVGILQRQGISLDATDVPPQLKPAIESFAQIIAHMLDPSVACINIAPFLPPLRFLAQVFSQ